jgi:hypothetical protein
VRLTTDALRRTISSAGLRTEDVSAMLLAGGSSRIPLVDQMVSEEFGRPVRMTLHPKFTVALGGAATSARVAAAPPRRSEPTSAPPLPAAAPSAEDEPKRRRKWPVAAAAAGVAIIAAVITTLVLVTGGNAQQSGADDSDTNAAGADGKAPKTMQVYGKKGPVDPYTSFIASADNWAGVDIAEGARQTSISATPDGHGDLRVKWAGGAPGQVYMQNPTDTEDKRAYVNANGGLVFDAVVNRRPASLVTVAVHCGYPCVAEVEATKLFRSLPPGKRTEVTIPLSCFTNKGLNPSSVNTPFLVYTTGAFDVTFSDVRWEPGVATSPQATKCVNLK